MARISRMDWESWETCNPRSKFSGYPTGLATFQERLHFIMGAHKFECKSVGIVLEDEPDLQADAQLEVTALEFADTHAAVLVGLPEIFLGRLDCQPNLSTFRL